jgi:hypothetical protein
MSTILLPPESRPDMPFDDELFSSRIEEITTAVGDEVSIRTVLNGDMQDVTVVVLSPAETSKVQETISSTEQSETPSTIIQNGGIAFTTSIESGSSTSETENGNGHLESGGGGLSTGALAGIGVVAGVIGLAALVAIWWFSKRYKVSRRTKNVDGGGQSAEQQIYEAPDNTKASQQIYEAPSSTRL